MGIFTLKLAGDASILNKKLTSVLKDNTSPEEKALFCLKDLVDLQALVALPSRMLIIKLYCFGRYHAASFLYRDIINIETVKGFTTSALKVYTPMSDNIKRYTLLQTFLPSALPSQAHNCFSFLNTFLPTFLPYFEKIETLVQESKKDVEDSSKKRDDSEATKSNIAEQIEKLSNLRQSGALTEEEYLQAKKKTLEA